MITIKQLIAGFGLITATSLMACAQGVGVKEFEAGIARPGVQVFDVRTTGEFNSGHLHQAMQADYTNKEQFKERVQYLNKQQPVYVYCLSGGRSAAAAVWMRENGFREVVELEGGINAWKQAGKPLEGVTAPGKQLSVTDFQHAVKTGWKLVDVGAAWCPPCRQMEPVLQAFLQQQPSVKLVKVDGGKDQEVMQAIGAKGLPTFILYKDGKEVWRQQGVTTLEVLNTQVK